MQESVGLTGVGLRLGYHGRQVVDGASLGIEPAAVTALVGPNGSGKSTLLRALARLHKPDAGDVAVRRRRGVALALSHEGLRAAGDVCSRSRGRRRTGSVCATSSATAGIRTAGAGGTTTRTATRAIEHAMDVTGVTAMAERAVDELSGGELQRVWLATCLAQDTGVLLLDEPTTFLDLRYQIEILDLMRDLADDHGVAVGVVLHDLNQAAAVADRVVLLDQGRVRATGTPAEVLQADALTETYGIRIDVSTDPVDRTDHHPAGRQAPAPADPSQTTDQPTEDPMRTSHRPGRVPSWLWLSPPAAPASRPRRTANESRRRPAGLRHRRRGTRRSTCPRRRPTKVVGLEWGVVENLITLGVMPVGVADVKGYTTWVSAAKLDAAVKDVGTRGESSVDAIVALEPRPDHHHHRRGREHDHAAGEGRAGSRRPGRGREERDPADEDEPRADRPAAIGKTERGHRGDRRLRQGGCRRQEEDRRRGQGRRGLHDGRRVQGRQHDLDPDVHAPARCSARSPASSA